jgi:C-terminal processing protease CtpA/Prc
MTTRVVGKAAILLAVAWAILGTKPILSQKHNYPTLSNAQSATMLDAIEKDIKDNYYDLSMHGVDLDKRFEDARTRIATAKTQDDAFLIIAGAVAALNDSHTAFVPPMRPYDVDYGFITQAIGDSDCYVTAVAPGSDAETKGLKPGDQIVSINGVRLVRQDIKTVQFGYRVFPQSGFHLDVRSPDGKERSLIAMAKVTPGQSVVSHSDVLHWFLYGSYLGLESKSKYSEVENKVLFWKFPDFEIDPQDVGGLAKKARSFQTVVLDLRGNPGGRVDVLDEFLGEFFDHDVKIGERVGRKGSKVFIAKGRGKGAIGGKLIVLIDSNSASAAELFSRTIQLQKRGTVLGDRSSGMVMTSEHFVHAVDLNPIDVTQYGAFISIGKDILPNGENLENVGVTPDERIVPSPGDIAAGRDPVLARAAALAGVEMSPEKAGQMFPFTWPRKRAKIE